jgi:hypothetical protein
MAQEVRPLVRVASDAVFEEQMRSLCVEGDEDLAEEGWTRAQATTRAKAARALLERGQARL